MPKAKLAVYLSEETLQMMKAIIQINNLHPTRGHSSAVEEAIKFYFGYLSGTLTSEYLCGVYGQQVDGIVSRSTDRLASILFKQAVEINVLTRLLAGETEISKDDYAKMRGRAVASVKKSAGKINLLDTIAEEDGEML